MNANLNYYVKTGETAPLVQVNLRYKRLDGRIEEVGSFRLNLPALANERLVTQRGRRFDIKVIRLAGRFFSGFTHPTARRWSPTASEVDRDPPAPASRSAVAWLHGGGEPARCLFSSCQVLSKLLPIDKSAATRPTGGRLSRCGVLGPGMTFYATFSSRQFSWSCQCPALSITRGGPSGRPAVPSLFRAYADVYRPGTDRLGVAAELAGSEFQ